MVTQCIAKPANNPWSAQSCLRFLYDPATDSLKVLQNTRRNGLLNKYRVYYFPVSIPNRNMLCILQHKSNTHRETCANYQGPVAHSVHNVLEILQNTICRCLLNKHRNCLQPVFTPGSNLPCVLQ